MDKAMWEQLNLDTSWGIGEQAFAALTAIVREKPGAVKTLVEFGSGASSIRLAKAFSESHIVSIESDQRCFQNTQQLAERYLKQANFTLLYQPLTFQTYGPGEILTYKDNNALASRTIDCVLIDGPPFYTLRGREACLYQIYEQLPIGGMIILDDYRRASEKAILKNWLAVYPQSFAVEILKVGHYLAVLRKLKDVAPRWNAPVKCQDSRQVRKHYRIIQSLLLQLGHKDLFNPSKRWNSLGRSILQVVLAMREAYGISAERIEAAAQRYATLSWLERQRLKIEGVPVCLHLLNLAR
jgi:hypothetical protein